MQAFPRLSPPVAASLVFCFSPGGKVVVVPIESLFSHYRGFVEPRAKIALGECSAANANSKALHYCTNALHEYDSAGHIVVGQSTATSAEHLHQTIKGGLFTLACFLDDQRNKYSQVKTSASLFCSLSAFSALPIDDQQVLGTWAYPSAQNSFDKACATVNKHLFVSL